MLTGDVDSNPESGLFTLMSSSLEEQGGRRRDGKKAGEGLEPGGDEESGLETTDGMLQVKDGGSEDGIKHGGVFDSIE